MFNTQVNTTERANFKHLVLDIAWFGLAFAATNRFLPVFAIRVGATAFELGLISSLPAFLLLVTATLGAWWRNRYHTTLRALMPVAFIVRLPFLLPALTPFFPPQWQPIWLVLSVTLPALAQGMAGVIFVVFIRETVSNQLMTQLLSLRQLALNIGIGIAAVLYGVWLETAPFPLNYQSMYILAFVFALMSQWHVSRCKTIVQTEVQPPTPLLQALRVPLLAWRSRLFHPVISMAFLTHFTLMIAAPFVTLFLVRQHGAAEGFVAVFGLVELASAALINTVTPRIVKAIGNRALAAAGMVGTGIGVIVIIFAPHVYLTLIGAAIIGASWAAAAGVGLFGFYMETAPAENNAPYSIAYHQALGLGMALGSTLGGWMASGGVPLIFVLLAGAMLRIAAGVIIEAPLARRHSAEIAAKVAH